MAEQHFRNFDLLNKINKKICSIISQKQHSEQLKAISNEMAEQEKKLLGIKGEVMKKRTDNNPPPRRADGPTKEGGREKGIYNKRSDNFYSSRNVLRNPLLKNKFDLFPSGTFVLLSYVLNHIKNLRVDA